MTTTTIVPNKRTSNTPVYLTAGQTSGSFTISIPFVAEYIMILNDTAATIAVMIGEQSTQGPEAQIWTPGTYLSLPLLQETQKLTVFWSSQSPITADNNLVQFYFSNVTIPLQGGKYGSAAESTNVDVMNTVTVQYGSIPNVNINAMPVISGSDGTNNHPLKTDATGQLNVNVETMPALAAGMNNIGHVNVDQIPAIPAGTNNIGHVNVDQLPALPTGSNVIGTVNQQALPGVVLNNTSAAITSTLTSSDLSVGQYREIDLDVNISAITGTGASYTLTVNRKGADGVYYPIYTGESQTAAGKISITIGVGASTNNGFGNTIQIVETIAGTTPSITRSVSVIGK